MEKRVLMRFIGMFVFIALFFIFVFMYFDNENSFITGNVVGGGDSVDDSYINTSDFNRIEGFFDDYKAFIDEWLAAYFSCLNQCPLERGSYIEIGCFDNCKELSGSKEYKLRNNLYKEYPKEEVQFYFKDSNLNFLNDKMNTLLLCLDDCENKKVCIKGCVDDLNKDPNEIVIPM